MLVNNQATETQTGIASAILGKLAPALNRPVAIALALATVACTTETQYHGKVNTFRNDVTSEKGMAVSGDMKPVVVGYVKPGETPQMDRLGSAMGRGSVVLSSTVANCSPARLCVVQYVPVPKNYQAIEKETVMTPALIRFAVSLTEELIRGGANYLAAGNIKPAEINNSISNMNAQTQSQWQSMTQRQQQQIINYINQHCTPQDPGSGIGQEPRGR